MLEATQQRPLIQTLGEIVSMWILSDVGYYILFPLLGIGSSFTSHPFIMSWYYLAWVVLAFFAFWEFYKKMDMVEVRSSLFIAVALGSVACAYYLTYLLPQFAPIQWADGWIPPSELLYATHWYFLPKSIEIVFQQLLVATMVLSFNAKQYSLPTISIWSAALFGGIHLLLVFSGSTVAYVTGFTLSAVIAGLIFPYLLLRVRNGFVYSYLIHWAFYAFVIVAARVFLIF